MKYKYYMNKYILNEKSMIKQEEKKRKKNTTDKYGKSRKPTATATTTTFWCISIKDQNEENIRY